MAVLTFSYETGAVPVSRILAAFAGTFNYQATIVPDPDNNPGVSIPNPETLPVFSKRMVGTFVRDVVKSYELKVATDAAVAAAAAGVTTVSLT